MSSITISKVMNQYRYHVPPHPKIGRDIKAGIVLALRVPGILRYGQSVAINENNPLRICNGGELRGCRHRIESKRPPKPDVDIRRRIIGIEPDSF